MKVFVCGATGVIGWRGVRELALAGHDVTAMVRSTEGPKAERAASAGATVVQVDLFDEAKLKDAVAGSDAVVNLATRIPSPRESLKSSAWTENSRIRTEGAHNLVQAALAAGASRYIQESIAFAYADRGDLWIDEEEPMPPGPFIEPVLRAEGEVARFTASGGTGTVLRFGNFYGPDSTHSQTMIRWARKGRFLLPGAPTAYWPFIHLDDAASAVLAALDAPAGTYHVVEDEPLTRAGAGAAMAAAIGASRMKLTPRVVTRATKQRAPNMVASQRVSNRRIRDATSWQPRYPSVREGFAALLAEVGP